MSLVLCVLSNCSDQLHQCIDSYETSDSAVLSAALPPTPFCWFMVCPQNLGRYRPLLTRKTLQICTILQPVVWLWQFWHSGLYTCPFFLQTCLLQEPNMKIKLYHLVYPLTWHDLSKIIIIFSLNVSGYVLANVYMHNHAENNWEIHTLPHVWGPEELDLWGQKNRQDASQDWQEGRPTSEIIEESTTWTLVTLNCTERKVQMKTRLANMKGKQSSWQTAFSSKASNE